MKKKEQIEEAMKIRKQVLQKFGMKELHAAGFDNSHVSIGSKEEAKELCREACKELNKELLLELATTPGIVRKTLESIPSYNIGEVVAQCLLGAMLRD